MKNIILFLLGFLIIIGCTEKPLKKQILPKISFKDIISPYKYSKDLTFYLQKEHTKSISNLVSNDSIFFLIPLDACISCIEETFKTLEINNFKGGVIIAGDTLTSHMPQDLISKIYRNKTTIFDLKNELGTYFLDISQPSAMLMRKNKIFKINLNNLVWPYLRKHLKWTKPKI